MSEHGNSLKNPNLHHLYQIHDKEKKDVFKYGISDDPIEKDGLSKRLRYRVNFLNRVVGRERFAGNILIENISGRKKAKEVEDNYIYRYRQRFGRNPIGNLKGGKKVTPKPNHPNG